MSELTGKISDEQVQNEYIKRVQKENEIMKKFILELSREELIEIEDYDSKSYFYLDDTWKEEAREIIEKLYPELVI